METVLCVAVASLTPSSPLSGLEDSNFCQILYDRRNQPQSPHAGACDAAGAMQCPMGAEDRMERDGCPCRMAAAPSSTSRASQGLESPVKPMELSPAVAKAKEFVADIFRRAKEAKGPAPAEEEEVGGGRFECRPAQEASPHRSLSQGTPADAPWEARLCSGPSGSYCRLHHGLSSPRGDRTPEGDQPPKDSPLAGLEMESQPAEPGYVNYTKLRYVLEPSDLSEPEDGKQSLGRPVHFLVQGLTRPGAGIVCRAELTGNSRGFQLEPGSFHPQPAWNWTYVHCNRELLMV